MTTPQALSEIVQRLCGPLELSEEHFQFLRMCSEPSGPTICDLAQQLLAQAIDQEIEIHRAIRQQEAEGEPSLTLDADTRLRMQNDLPPWEGPLVITRQS